MYCGLQSAMLLRDHRVFPKGSVKTRQPLPSAVPSRKSYYKVIYSHADIGTKFLLMKRFYFCCSLNIKELSFWLQCNLHLRVNLLSDLRYIFLVQKELCKFIFRIRFLICFKLRKIPHLRRVWNFGVIWNIFNERFVCNWNLKHPLYTYNAHFI